MTGIVLLFCLAIVVFTTWFVIHRVRIILHRQRVQHEANQAIIARERRERNLS